MLRGWLEHDGLSQLRLEYGAGATPDEWLEIATLSEIPRRLPKTARHMTSSAGMLPA